MKINPWRIAAYCTTFCAVGGTLLSIFLDGNTLGWASVFIGSATWTRVEWVLAALLESKKNDDHDED